MNIITDIFKFSLLKKVSKNPVLYLFRNENKLLINYLKELFEYIVFENLESFKITNKKYKTIIIDELTEYNLKQILDNEGFVCLFSQNHKKVENELFLNYKFVESFKLNVDLVFYLIKTYNNIEFKGNENEIQSTHLVIASNSKITPLDYQVSIPFNSFNDIFNSFFIPNDIYNNLVKKYNNSIEKINDLNKNISFLTETNAFLQKKQQIIKKDFNDLLKKQKENNI